MPSPVGHTIAGLGICYALMPNRNIPVSLIVIAVVAANFPDLDFLPGMVSADLAYDAFHRGASHSLLFAIGTSLIAALLFRYLSLARITGATRIWVAGVFSHLLLDWLSADSGPPMGIPLLWPVSSTHLISSPTLFFSVERDDFLTTQILMHNLIAVSVELLVMCPILFVCWQLNKYRSKSAAA